jgi:hypothetical protein
MKKKYLLFASIFMINVLAGYGQYISTGWGTLSDPTVWTLPWVGAPLPPGGSQSVVISAGTTITGSTSNTYQLDVLGTLIISGDYNNGSGGLTIEDGGVMVITGNLNSNSSIVINGTGKLMVLGNLNENGGSITINNNGILVVGKIFSEGWQNTTVNNYGTILVIQEYKVDGNLNKSGTAQVAILGTVTGSGCSGCTNTISTSDPAWIFWLNGEPNYWTGASNSSWTNTANWSKNSIPATGLNVEFACPGTNDLVLDIDRTVGNLINKSSKRMLIPPGKCLTVNRTIITSNDPNQLYIQSSSSTASGSLIFHNTVGSPVQATVEMYSLASWNLTNGIGGKYRWQYFGIPVRSITSASPTFDGSYVRELHENDIPNHWYQLNNASGLTSFHGYEITQEAAKTYIFKGQLENGDYSVTQPFTSGATYPGESLIGNSYTAAIDIKKIVFGSQMLATVYLYNTGTRNDWVANGQNPIDSTTALAGQYTAVPIGNAGLGSLPGTIPSMQAFLVRAKMNDSHATVTIPYSTATTVVGNTTRQRISGIKKDADSLKIWTIVDVKGSQFSDRMWIFTNPDCSHGFDNGWDGEKLFGSSMAPQIYSMEADGDYQVNTVNDMNNTDIGFYAGVDSVYTITFTGNNNQLKYSRIYLQDLLKHTINDITQSGSTYTFAAKSSDGTVKRFKILTKRFTPTSLENVSENNKQVYIFSSEQQVFVHNLSDVKGTLTLYSISGQMLKQVTFAANAITTIPVNLPPGIYIALGKTSYGEVSERLIIR